MTTQIYNINEAEANFPRLMDEVASGKEVIIGREGIPLARISRIDPNIPKIRFDVLKGRAKVTEDFDSPLRPLLDELQSLQFRLAPRTYSAVLHLAGESD